MRQNWGSSKVKEIWIDGMLINILANLCFVVTAYYFRENIFQYFHSSKALMSSNCTKLANDRKSIHSCVITIKNSQEAELKDYRFLLASSSRFNNFNFLSCKPDFGPNGSGDTIAVETKVDGESSCKYRLVALGAYDKIKFKLEINGDDNEPDPEILQ